MVKVNTVVGPISEDQLGKTLMHEHLIFGYPGWEFDTAAPPYDRKAAAKACLDAIAEAKGYGVKTIVDATPADGTRDPELYKEVSEKSGVNIICATGLYTEFEGAPAYFRFRGQLGDAVAEIYEMYMKDITQGIGTTGVKAGVIKVATGDGAISAYEEKLLKAAARAQKETGVPIITHTEAGTMGPEQADFLIGEGVDPKRIMVGHIGGNANLQYQTTVLGKGVHISFDRLGLDFVFPDTLRKACIIGLIGIGYANKIHLSQDYIMQWLGRPFVLPEIAAPLIANWSLVHVFKNIIPALKEAGVTDEQINTIMVENPRRLFAGE